MHLEQYEPQTSSWKGSLMMFVAGTAIGAVAALIMAPASGRDSRAYLRRQSRKVADDVTAQADRFAEAVKWGRDHASSAVKETMDSAVAQAKAAYNAAKTQRTSEMSSASANTPRPAPARSMNS